MPLNMRARLILCVMVWGTVLAGCGVPDSGPDPYAVRNSSLAITSFGPTEIHAGVPFNRQPDGSSAVWIRVKHPVDGSHVAIHFDGTALQTVIRGSLLTARVPARLYAKPGIHALWVAGKNQDGARISSNKVKMIAK